MTNPKFGKNEEQRLDAFLQRANPSTPIAKADEPESILAAIIRRTIVVKPKAVSSFWLYPSLGGAVAGIALLVVLWVGFLKTPTQEPSDYEIGQFLFNSYQEFESDMDDSSIQGKGKWEQLLEIEES